MQQETPRTCKICGSPNHHGCGCEAKQKQAALQVETENLKPGEQPEAEDDILEAVFSPEAIKESDKVNRQMAQDIKIMADGFEGLCACMYDTNNYLKLIAGDLITIRKVLLKEDKVDEVGIGMTNIASLLSNIHQQLKEMNVRGQDASKNQN